MQSFNTPIVKEVSAGGVPFFVDQTGQVFYLLLRYRKAGHWAFPKGHIEVGETLIETAKREIYEETGQSQFTILCKLPKVSVYWFRRQNGIVEKTVHYYLVRFHSKKLRLSSEHDHARWVSYEEAHKLLRHKNDYDLLNLAKEKIDNMIK